MVWKFNSKLMLAIILVSLVAIGCSAPTTKHPKVNMTQIMEKYNSIHDMGGVATVDYNGVKSSVVFAFIKPNKYAEWFSPSGKVILFNGSVKTIHINNSVKYSKDTFNPYDYGKILKNGKISYSDDEILVRNNFGSVWLNYKLLPVEIQWNNGIKITIRKLYLNKGWGEDLFSMYNKENKTNTAGKLINIQEAQKKVNFQIVVPTYTSNCKFIGALVFNNNGSKAVVLYYGEELTNKTLTITEGKKKVGGISNVEVTYISGKKVLKGIACGKLTGYEFTVNGINVTVYGNLPDKEMVKVVESMLK